ncbi:DNA-3-methyladenine glycosylase I [Anaerovibrio sp.]|uniref:DNA-3-methyladenine glycosylase I n=1 Tax=Anaerovibrio sp. TaxID=1872532 RepID=UPI003F139CF3
MERKRCSWCNINNPLYVRYHDEEWGIPLRDDGRMFELLVLESFQAGLSWECILNKREAFRMAFDDFAVAEVACYDEAKIKSLLANPRIVRNRRKIEAAIANAGVFMAIQREFGSFDRYIWQWTSYQTVCEQGLASSHLSDEVSGDLKRRGMKFVGTKIIYSFLQAIGVIYSHEEGCYLARLAGGQACLHF